MGLRALGLHFFFIHFGSREDLCIGIFFSKIFSPLGWSFWSGFGNSKETAIPQIKSDANQHETSRHASDKKISRTGATSHEN